MIDPGFLHVLTPKNGDMEVVRVLRGSGIATCSPQFTLIRTNARFMRKICVLIAQGNMMKTDESKEVRLSLVVSGELNARLEEIADGSHTTKSDILRKALALYDVVADAKQNKNRLGIFDKDKNLLTEIVGI